MGKKSPKHMIKQNYEVDILVNGKTVKEYKHEGRIYIEGRKGSNFSLRIKNNGWDEILAVPSIDGLSVMDGKPCSADKSRGYIIKAHSSVTIDGWRTSDREVAEFYFSNVEDSYAERTDRDTENTGVIGVAIFGKKWSSYVTTSSLNWPSYGGGAGGSAGTTGTGGPIDTSRNSGDLNLTAGSAQIMAMNSSSEDRNLVSYKSFKQDVATGFGAAKKSEIERVYFGREDVAREVFKIYYNTKEQLKEIGVDTNREVVHVSEPEAFPGDYCQPPRK